MSSNKEEKVLIDLGCGEGIIKKEGFRVIRVDIRPETKPDIIWDLEKFPYPFQDEIADEIYWKDSLEHLSWRVVRKALEETYRILKKGGNVFIQCPDLEAIARKIILDPNFKYGDLYGYKAISFWVYGRQDEWGGAHKAGFTAPALKQFLSSIGFKDIKIRSNGGTNLLCTAIK